MSDALNGHVSHTLDGPLVILFEQVGADQAGHGSFVGKMPTSVQHLISPLRHVIGLVLSSLVRCCGKVMQAGTSASTSSMTGQHALEEAGEFWQLGPQLISDAAPLLAGSLGTFWARVMAHPMAAHCLEADMRTGALGTFCPHTSTATRGDELPRAKLAIEDGRSRPLQLTLMKAELVSVCTNDQQVPRAGYRLLFTAQQDRLATRRNHEPSAVQTCR